MLAKQVGRNDKQLVITYITKQTKYHVTNHPPITLKQDYKNQSHGATNP